MATIEGKPETIQEPKPDEPKPESNSKEVEENQEPALKYKAWVLKVSIHCEACKRKVEKILRKIDGVYEVDPDLKQQKVTVKANLHVDVDTLIKRLVKKGRHAELWPEQKEKKGKSKNKDKQAAQSNNEECNNNGGGEGGGGGGDHIDKEAVRIELLSVLQDNNASKSCENIGGCSCNTPINSEGFNGQVPFTCNQSPVPENKAGGGGGGGGGGGSKKKKKGHKGNATVTFDEGHQERPVDAGPAPTGSQFTGYGPYGPIPMSSPANHSPPRHHMDEYPTYYRPPPVYATSYNAAPSYYTSPRPYSCMYMDWDRVSEHSSSLDAYSSRPCDSFEMLSDENPNACSIM